MPAEREWIEKWLIWRQAQGYAITYQGAKLVLNDRDDDSWVTVEVVKDCKVIEYFKAKTADEFRGWCYGFSMALR